MNVSPLGEKAAVSRVNLWVEPSFTEESLPRPGRRKNSPSLCSGAEMKRPRKRRGESSGAHLLREAAHRDQDEAWVDRYRPRTQAELAVHKKKIEEVERWISAHTNTSKGGVLLLTGPSGCGKTAAVQVLCGDLGLRLQDWTNPTNVEPYSSSSLQEWRMNGSAHSSQSAQFQEFLLRANKYSCLKMSGDGGGADRKLILVEDFPNQFYRQPSSLHDILRRFVRTSRCPLVFIVSDSLSGHSSSRFLFPREIQEELNICNISFNPVAPTTMMKVLTSISMQEAGQSCGRMCVPDQALLESLCSGSSGDVRSAINSLQFSSLPDTSLERGLWRTNRAGTSRGRGMSRTNQRKKMSRPTKEAEEEEQPVGGKDASLFLFRALGKILHCKRESHGGGAAGGDLPVLPSHLSHHHREPLLINPEVVVERSHLSGEFFSLYLHQNYLDFFSEVEDVDRASEYLSDADLLTADWTSRGALEDYGCSVATRGLLHSNSQQVCVGFRPLHKPSWLLVSKKHHDNCVAAETLFRSFSLTPVSLQTELLPYLDKLTCPLRTQAQITFVQDVGQMSLRRFAGRSNLETLTDKEPGQLQTDSEEEEEGGVGGGEGGLPASQPQLTAQQVVVEEEELLIEEYTSD